MDLLLCPFFQRTHLPSSFTHLWATVPIPILFKRFSTNWKASVLAKGNRSFKSQQSFVRLLVTFPLDQQSALPYAVPGNLCTHVVVTDTHLYLYPKNASLFSTLLGIVCSLVIASVLPVPLAPVLVLAVLLVGQVILKSLILSFTFDATFIRALVTLVPVLYIGNPIT